MQKKDYDNEQQFNLTVYIKAGKNIQFLAPYSMGFYHIH